jgi:molybdate transport system substrate-binding protein
MASISVFTSNGQRTVMAELAPRFEKATGHKVTASYDPGQIMMRRIDAGETADVVILGGSALDDLARKGRIAAGSTRAYSSCGIGVAVAAGLDKPISARSKRSERALLAAKSVAYTIEARAASTSPA